MHRPSLPAPILALLLLAASLHAAPINGSFETGNFTGWSLITAPGGFGTVANSYTSPNPPPSSFSPTHGSWLAFIGGGQEDIYTTLGQVFTATAGEVLRFDLFFKAEDANPNNDDAFANLYDGSNNLIASLFTSSVRDVGDFGTTGWVSINYTFTSNGTFLLLFGVRNMGDSANPSVLGIDNVRLSSSPPPTRDVIPEPSTAWLALVGFLGVVAGLRRSRTVPSP